MSKVSSKVLSLENVRETLRSPLRCEIVHDSTVVQRCLDPRGSKNNFEVPATNVNLLDVVSSSFTPVVDQDIFDQLSTSGPLFSVIGALEFLCSPLPSFV